VRQFHLSLVIVTLSFITVKQIQLAGADRYRFFREYVQIQNGWYNMNEDNSVEQLPFGLHTQTGISTASYHKVCLFDENNQSILFYDLKGDSIHSVQWIGDYGHCQSFTSIDNQVFVLNTDAELHFVSENEVDDKLIPLKLEGENETYHSICTDKRQNRLLIASSSVNETPSDKIRLRTVWMVDMGTKELLDDPLFTIDVNTLEAFVNENNYSPEQLQSKKREKATQLMLIPNSIAVHPKSDEIYILSAVDKTIFVFNKTGKILQCIHLDTHKYSSPQQVSFLPNGDLLISNEGPMMIPTLHRITWNRYLNPAD
jgi:hypothetical protein